MVIRSIFAYVALVVLELLFPGGEVKMNLNTPVTVDAGKTFRVSITLSKSDVNSFSRFAQDIPAGLTATSVNSANADFTFKDNRVRFIWLKLPDTDTFTVSYDVKVDERLKGTFDLAGKFSFIDKNERKSVDLQAKQITIIPSPNVDPKFIVDIKDFKEKVIPQLFPVDVENVACVRQKPDLNYSDKEILVNILVNKGSRQKFAKIEEQVPEGYVAVAVDKKDAIFAFRDQTAKFLWMTLPAEPYFTVSYKLIPQNKHKVETLPITGSFSYIDGQKNSSVPIVEQDVNLEKLNKEQVGKILATIPGYLSKPAEATSQLALEADSAKTKMIASTNNLTDKNKKLPVVKNLVQPIDTAKKPSLVAKNIELKETTSFSYILEPETGVYYRVQIAAGHKPIGLRKYFRKLTFNQDIKTEQHQGWYKYSIGSWSEYKKARDFRLHVWSTTPIKDAFVAAYNAGKRITVQEALMISNQKWYL